MVKSKEHVQSNPAIAIDNIYTPIFRRSLFTIGIIMRYFDFKSRKVLGIDEGRLTKIDSFQIKQQYLLKKQATPLFPQM